MTVYLLPEDLPVFPDPRRGEPDGLLALGGGLEPARLLLAYSRGIFPWNGPDEPIMWYCPAPRMVLQLPQDLHVPRTLRKRERHGSLQITLDTDFLGVLTACAEQPRPGQDRTWITPELTAAFTALHGLGCAHSVEVRDGDELVGGLYGLAIGAVFFGESMFSRRPYASRLAFVALARQLIAWQFQLIDCQLATEHLRSLGGRELDLEAFLAALGRGVRAPGRLGPWSFDPAPPLDAEP